MKPLTPRERQVAAMIAQGLPQKSIAEALKIGLSAIQGHRTVISRKLGEPSLAAIVHYALAEGLLPNKFNSLPVSPQPKETLTGEEVLRELTYTRPTLRELTLAYTQQILTECSNKTRAARILGCARSRLYRLPGMCITG